MVNNEVDRDFEQMRLLWVNTLAKPTTPR